MFSALHIASSKGHLSIVEMLVAFNKNIIDWENKYGRTALLTAASTCKTDVVKFLLDNNAAIAEDYEFFNCLDWSIIKNDKQSAMVMMNHDRWKEVRKWSERMKLQPNMAEFQIILLCHFQFSDVRGQEDCKCNSSLKFRHVWMHFFV